jgi:hypothetical protein
MEFRTNAFLGGFWDQNGDLTGTGNLFAQGFMRIGVTNNNNVMQIQGSNSTSPVGFTLNAGNVGFSTTAAQANSGTNVAHILDNSVALTGTTLLLSVRNNAVEKFKVTNAGDTTVNNLTVNGTCTGCGGSLTVGAPANGLAIASNQITLASATGAAAGAVTLSAQTLGAGVKTFTSATHSSGFYADNGGAQDVGILSAGGNLNGFHDTGTDLQIQSLGSNSLYIHEADQSTHVASYFYVTDGDTSGTPGNATSNTSSGKSAVAGSGATTVVITDNFVGANSRVFTQLVSKDTTCTALYVTVAAGSFTATCSAATTLATTFFWFVLNK